MAAVRLHELRGPFKATRGVQIEQYSKMLFGNFENPIDPLDKDSFLFLGNIGFGYKRTGGKLSCLKSVMAICLE